MNPLFLTDGYKLDHRSQYPEGTELVYSNFTPRSDRLSNMGEDFDGKIVVFGTQAMIQEYFIDLWNDEFFSQPKEKVIGEYKELVEAYLGPDAITFDHVEALHDLGYLPIEIRGLEEGTRSPMRVPVFTIHNTLSEFFWLTNYFETFMSAEAWKPFTNATIAFEYNKILTKAAIKTGAPVDFVPLQGHDFSLRGMSGIGDPAGAAHLTSFMGTDSIPAIVRMNKYYKAENYQVPIGLTVPATEHSVMCMGGLDDEKATFRRLFKELYPTGIVSIVSDTWDFWKVIIEFLPEMKDEIMARKPNALGLNKVVIRPDSGDPVKIITGYKIFEAGENGDVDLAGIWNDGFEAVRLDECNYELITKQRGGELAVFTGDVLQDCEVKGAIECLWETFGGTTTDKGYKMLDEHIGLIYGDSITLERAQIIVDRLADKGFASTNVVFGIGSYTYQYSTRDTFGFAMKATAGRINGEYVEIFKDPKTDSGEKKSAKGFLTVLKDRGVGDYTLYDQEPHNRPICELKVLFKDGKLLKRTDIAKIRANIAEELKKVL